MQLRVGCAGWTIRTQYASRFPAQGSHLTRYAQHFPGVEVNSCFYRSHRPSTYARWAAETPAAFAFSLKVPKEITHEGRLNNTDGAITRFLDETAELGPKRGPILVQLPPSLSFNAKLVGDFFTALRRQYDGAVVCEPRHASWFAAGPETLLTQLKVARVAADPPVAHDGGRPGMAGHDLLSATWIAADVLFDVFRRVPGRLGQCSSSLSCDRKHVVHFRQHGPRSRHWECLVNHGTDRSLLDTGRHYSCGKSLAVVNRSDVTWPKVKLSKVGT